MAETPARQPQATAETPVLQPQATAERPAASAPTPQEPPPFAAALAALPAATTVHLRAGWRGYSPRSPISHTYDFELTPEGFRVRTVCRSAGEGELDSVNVPAEQVTRLLARLATVDASPGPYEALIRHTDDYPDVAMEIDSPVGSVSFSSQSQGREHAPWQIAVAETQGVVDSTLPGEVMEQLIALPGADRCRDWLNHLPRRTRTKQGRRRSEIVRF
ncbi:MAG: hypothetical protein GXP55_09705 [Deltaproteobacteria bacterium]|nr:hypothetical protein [Deltaproteobacteria bacterium]